VCIETKEGYLRGTTSSGVVGREDIGRSEDIVSEYHDIPEGFTAWSGVGCPVPLVTQVEILSKGGALRAGKAAFMDWWHEDCIDDIIGYRVVAKARPPITLDTVKGPHIEIERLVTGGWYTCLTRETIREYMDGGGEARRFRYSDDPDSKVSFEPEPDYIDCAIDWGAGTFICNGCAYHTVAGVPNDPRFRGYVYADGTVSALAVMYKALHGHNFGYYQGDSFQTPVRPAAVRMGR